MGRCRAASLAVVVPVLVLLKPSPTFARAPLAVHVRATSPADYTVELTLDPDSVPMTTALAGGLVLTRVALGSAVARAPAGSPDVPVLRRLLAVQPGQRYQVHVTLAGRVTINNVVLAPVQPDRPDNGARAPLVFDAVAYALDQDLGAETVSLGQPVQVGPVTMLPVNLSPIHYNPVRRQLVLWRQVTAYLHAEGASGDLNPNHRTLTPFQLAQVRALTDNAAAVARSFPVVSQPRLLVITTADLLPKAKELQADGRLGAYAVDYQTVAAGATAADIHRVIATSYAQGGLNAVLLFGDRSKIPLYRWPQPPPSTATVPGDSWYARVEGTPYADVGLGRLPVHDADEAAIILGKLAKYDQLQRGGYTNKGVLLVADKEEYPGKYTANQENIRQAPNPAGLRFVTAYGGAGATEKSLIDETERGYGIIAYRGHGDRSGWIAWDRADADFSTEQILGLRNYDQALAVYFSIACDTGALQNDPPSMAELLLLGKTSAGNPRHGAIAVVASTLDSFTDGNNTFNQYLFDGLQNGPATDLGTLVAQANNRLVRDSGGVTPPNVEMYLLFGDPTLRPWVQ